MTTEIGIQVVAPAICTVIVALTAWSLKRNVADLDKKLSAIATDLRQLSSTVGSHGERLAQGGEKFAQLEREIHGLLERERERGCFSRCVVQQRAS